jgi:hypothetical protein
MHTIFHNARLNPAKHWDKQHPDNVAAYVQAVCDMQLSVSAPQLTVLQMNEMFPPFARCEDNWASFFIAQQYGQNWRKNDKKERNKAANGLRRGRDEDEEDEEEDEEEEDDEEDEEDEEDEDEDEDMGSEP